jgi:hypothetical protein
MQQIIISTTAFIVAMVIPFSGIAAVDSGWQGSASGSFSVNGKTVNLKYAYVMEEPDPFDEKATVISVLLTPDPQPQDAFNVGSLFYAVDKTKPSILYTIDNTGKTRREVIIHPGIESGGAEFSGATYGKMDFDKKTHQQVSGSIALKFSNTTLMGFKYAVKATFNAPLMQAKRKAAPLDASTGTPLPADGGEIGKALKTYISALRNNDLKTIRRMSPPEASKNTDKELVQIAEMMSLMTPKDLKIVRGFMKDSLATLYVSGTGDSGKEFGIINIVGSNGTWIVDGQSWSEKSFDEHGKEEKQAAFKKYKDKMDAMCANPEHRAFYLKAPCYVNDTKAEHLSDKTTITPEQKTALAKMRTMINELNNDSVQFQLTYEGEQGIKAAHLMESMMFPERDKNLAALSEGKITWGQYNQRRQELDNLFRAEMKK